MKAVAIILIVIAVLIGGLLTLRSTRNMGMPDQDVLDRAKERERARQDDD